MESFILPLLAFLFCFLAFVSCIRFLFSHQGLYWIIPLAISTIIGWFCGIQLLSVTSLGNFYQAPFSKHSWVLLLLSAFWLMGVMTFRYALKKTVAHNKHLDETWKNYHEARYLQKVTFRRYKVQTNRRRRNNAPGSYVPDRDIYPAQWLDYFN